VASERLLSLALLLSAFAVAAAAASLLLLLLLPPHQLGLRTSGSRHHDTNRWMPIWQLALFHAQA